MAHKIINFDPHLIIIYKTKSYYCIWSLNSDIYRLSVVMLFCVFLFEFHNQNNFKFITRAITNIDMSQNRTHTNIYNFYIFTFKNLQYFMPNSNKNLLFQDI